MAESFFDRKNDTKKSAFSMVEQNQQEFRQNLDVSSQLDHKSCVIFEGMEESEKEKISENKEQANEDYYCMVCQTNYNFKISLCNHKRRHELKYQCDYDNCDRTFSIESGLQRHRRIHSGLKQFQCDYDQCKKKFNQRSNLNRHKRIHKSQKPFICNKCCKSFTTTTNLKQHVQIHSSKQEGRKKYHCEINGCQKQYLYMCNLKKHKQQHKDPLSDYISQKRPEYQAYSFYMGNSRLKICYKKYKDHPETLITFKQISGAVIYPVDFLDQVVQKCVTEMDDIQQNQDQQENATIYQLENKIKELLSKVANTLNICFELHDKWQPIINIIVKTLINLTNEMNFKFVTILIDKYSMFKDIVFNLMNDLDQ